MAVDDVIQIELMLNRFRRLMAELQSGTINRNNFEPWEIEILLDLESCQVQSRRWTETLRQYEKTVERQLEGGFGPPMKLSEYLALRAQKKVSNF
ncbi:MAG: hypothetical protein LAP40_15060 [Acidobacteriia bacterium]|nr:hypothetical protein [Terriglobia bacterium]